MPANSVFLALIAAVAIAGGGIAAFVYMEKKASEPVSEAEAEFIAEQSQLTTELMQESLDARIEGLQETERERLDSPTGQALMTRCLEWQQFHADHPTATTESNREKACGEFERYIDTGELPESDE